MHRALPATQELLDKAIVVARRSADSDTGWDEVLSLIQRSLGAIGASFFIPAIEANEPQYVASSGISVWGYPDYFQNWAIHDPWWQAAQRSGLPFVPGTVAFTHEILPLKELHRTAFYSDFARRYDFDNAASLFVAGGSSGVPPIQIAVHRRIGASEFGERERAVLRYLSEPLEQAALTFWSMRRMRRFSSAAEEALSMLPTPAVVVSRELAIEFCNRAAELELALGAWMASRRGVLDRVGQLRRPQLKAFLDNPLQVSVEVESAAEDGVDGSREIGMLRIARLGPDSKVLAQWPRAYAIVTLERAAAPDDSAHVQAIAKRFNLTSKEAAVFAMLLSGLVPKEAADRLNISLSTVRTHVRGIYSKLGVHRQGELIRVALGIRAK